MALADHYLLVDSASIVREYGCFPADDKSVVGELAGERGLSPIWGVAIGSPDVVGQYWDGKKLVPVERSVSRAELAQRIARARWEREIGGTNWQGRPVNTERDAVAILAAAIMQGETQSVWPARWKFNDGLFYDMTAGDFQQLGLAVRAHINAAFAWEDAQLIRLSATPDVELGGFTFI